MRDESPQGRDRRASCAAPQPGLATGRDMPIPAHELFHVRDLLAAQGLSELTQGVTHVTHT